MTPTRSRQARVRRPHISAEAWRHWLGGLVCLLLLLGGFPPGFLNSAKGESSAPAEQPAGTHAPRATRAPHDSPAAGAESWEALEGTGILFQFAARDRTLATWLWPTMLEDRKTITEALRMFPTEPLHVLLAPTLEIFAELVQGQPADRTLGVYLLGRGIIVLRAPRTDPSGNWDPRGVLKHELVHALIDMEVRHPIPLWLHEGMAILLSGELSYLDEARLTWVAVTDSLIPLAVLFDRFPHAHGSRELAYAQAASFVRFLLRRGGMTDLRTLLDALAQGLTLPGALAVTYGEAAETLEQSWRDELASRFSWLTLLTSTTLLGVLALPLVLAGALRRRWQRRRKFAEWGAESSPANIPGPFPPGAPRPIQDAESHPPESPNPRLNGSGGPVPPRPPKEN